VADTDGDGLPDGDEVIAYGSDPLAPDSDGDGLPDGVEVAIAGDPFSAQPAADQDGDGLSNLEEVLLGTSTVLADTDGDGTSDGLETLRGCDPLTPELTRVAGLVVDAGGLPLAAARVQVAAVCSGEPSRPPSRASGGAGVPSGCWPWRGSPGAGCAGCPARRRRSWAGSPTWGASR
jgi:hypothetical protein